MINNYINQCKAKTFHSIQHKLKFIVSNEMNRFTFLLQKKITVKMAKINQNQQTTIPTIKVGSTQIKPIINPSTIPPQPVVLSQSPIVVSSTNSTNNSSTITSSPIITTTTPVVISNAITTTTAPIPVSSARY